MMPATVIKRDGRVVAFTEERISEAIRKAAESVHYNSDMNQFVEESTDLVINKINERVTNKITVEEIQDIVEHCLTYMNSDVAIAYIRYREKRNIAREAKSSTMKTMEELTFSDSLDSDTKRENANINTDSAMGTMLKYGSEISKTFTCMELLRPEVSEAHKNGDLHIHK